MSTSSSVSVMLSSLLLYGLIRNWAHSKMMNIVCVNNKKSGRPCMLTMTIILYKPLYSPMIFTVSHERICHKRVIIIKCS